MRAQKCRARGGLKFDNATGGRYHEAVLRKCLFFRGFIEPVY